jgi:hypothetical protein
MGSINNPVGRGPRDPIDSPFHVEPVDEDKLAKHEREREPDEGPPDEKLGIASFLLQLFHKVVDFFLEGKAHSSAALAKENLLKLKTSLEILKKEDRSQDMEFLSHLAKMWRQSLEDSLHFTNNETALKFKTLAKKIQHYPENQTHTFGYYLAEYINPKWIPFPYMELIQKIHTEHENNPTSSSLAEWTNLIDEIASLLQLG